MPAFAAALTQAVFGRADLFAELGELAPEDAQGWGSDHPMFELMFDWVPTRTYVEVGVWKGGSALRAAETMRGRGIDGAVVAVDTWLGGEEHFDYPDMRRRAGYPRLYETFMSNAVHRGVQDYVVPIPATSHIAALVLKRKGVSADVIYVDASHEYVDVIADLRDYRAIVRPGGLFFGDDYHWTWPGVIQAVRQFAAEANLRIYIWSTKYLLLPQDQPAPHHDWLDVTDRPRLHLDLERFEYRDI